MTTTTAPILTPAALDPAPPASRPRVLVSAYALSPVRGSEPGVGWNICLRLARQFDVTVLTAPGVPGAESQRYRTETDAYFAEHGPVSGLNLHYVNPPLLSRWFQRESMLLRRTMYYTGYAAWQRQALREARRLHADKPFDLVHQLSITGYRDPGYLWRLDVPFVWGPIGGAANFPDGYFDMLDRRDRFFYSMRNAANRRQRRRWRCRAAARRAGVVLAIGPEDLALARSWGANARPMLETGAAPVANVTGKSFPANRRLRLVFSGQHIGRKALPIVLRALSRLKSPPPELIVIGQGPCQELWKSEAAELGLASVRWTGLLPRDRALAEMSAADMLVFPSVLEGTPHVVLEALALGLPVICHDACGMGSAVDDTCGIRVALCDTATSVAGFAAAIAAMASDPALLVRLSAGALRRASELGWDAKAVELSAIYRRILADNAVSAGRRR